MDIDLLNGVTGGAKLLAWFGGRAPSFHDAEVLSIAFDRAGPTCILRVHGFEMTDAVDAEGFYVLNNHAVMTFRLEEVTAMRLDDFNHQNALMGLRVIRAADQGFRIELDPAYGLAGFVEARALTIGLEPGVPPGSQYEIAPKVR